MEIEKKYRIETIPPQILEQYPYHQIEQGYLAENPTIRIRKWDQEYWLTYKSREGVERSEQLSICQEIELPLQKEAYEHLRTKIDGNLIRKKRYVIPFSDGLKIELDVFQDQWDGFAMAEVEFESIEQGESFVAPDWFGEDVSGDYHYSNSYLSKKM